MSLHDCTLHLVVSQLDDGTQLGRILLYPEATAYQGTAEEVRDRAADLARKLHDDLPLLELHRRHSPGAVEVQTVELDVQPPAHLPAWQTPVQIRFHVVCWYHGEAAAIAYVPALDIEVVADGLEDLGQRLADEIRFAILRNGSRPSLQPLVWLDRRQAVAVETITQTVHVRTPKEIAQGKLAVSPQSVLADVATDLRKASRVEVFGLKDVVARLDELLHRTSPQSVLMVGPSGVGKTAAVRKLASRRGGGPFWSTSGARLVAGMCGFGMWQERCQAICAETARTRAPVHLGNLVELLQLGRSVYNNQGVADFLRPSIVRGDLLAIAECTPEQLALIERESPSLVEAFARLDVPEPQPDECRSILAEAARAWAGKIVVAPGCLETLDRLHRRYATYSSFPGRPLRFLKNLLHDLPACGAAVSAACGTAVSVARAGGTPTPQVGELALSAADVTAAFSRETGLPLVLLEPSERLDLDATAGWFSARVIGQAHAVRTVVDVLATVKAGLSRPGRPIASLFFIGPTGVGKTEMAKSLAEFLYHDRQRMIRIDMSEYADPLAADRLIGGVGGEGILTAKVREQPFAVVLLDEFEKAHPQLFDLLLQVLGEGRLCDAAGRLADFRNAVIIMTSNLGVESFGRQTAGFGGLDLTREAQQHFAREVQRFLRPEMFNRIDRIVTFLPLEKAALRDIARRELNLLNLREGIRYRDVTMAFDDSLVDEIVRRGYDPRYGARPIKRAVQEHLVAPLAAQLNGYSAKLPLQAFAAIEARSASKGVQGQTSLAPGASLPLTPEASSTIEARSASKGVEDQTSPTMGTWCPRRALTAGSTASSLTLRVTVRREPGTDPEESVLELAESCQHTRRNLAALAESGPVVEVQNELYRLEKEESRRRARGRKGPPDNEHHTSGQVVLLRRLVQRLDALLAEAVAREETVLLQYYQGKTLAPGEFRAAMARHAAEVDSLRQDYFATLFDQPDFVTLVVYGEDRDWMLKLAEAYQRLFLSLRHDVQAYEITVWHKLDSSKPERFPLGQPKSSGQQGPAPAAAARLQAERFQGLEFYARERHPALRGVGFCVRGRLAWPLWGAEAGLHVWKTEQNKKLACLVDIQQTAMTDYRPPDRIDRREGLGDQELCRSYDRARKTVEDRGLDQRLRWDDDLGAVIRTLAAEHLARQMKECFGS